MRGALRAAAREAVQPSAWRAFGAKRQGTMTEAEKIIAIVGVLMVGLIAWISLLRRLQERVNPPEKDESLKDRLDS